jgi:predicted nucleic acid-binding protein
VTETVYLETSFISYLVSRPSNVPIILGHQQTTHLWWKNRRSSFECFTSQVTIDEASAGNAQEIQKRLSVLRDIPLIDVDVDSTILTKAIIDSAILPPHAFPDAAHIAVAASHEIDYLLTWNCKHLANAQIRRRITKVCEAAGYKMPLICTPEELMGE